MSLTSDIKRLYAAYTYTFNEADAKAAYDEWGANCGPCALAFALQTTLDAVRPAIPEFHSRLYTSPTMMDAALQNLGAQVVKLSAPKDRGASCMFDPTIALVRVQWTGPWTANGKTQKWAARQTHWIATWLADDHYVFDVNGGIQRFENWDREIVPAITATIPRADGGWWPANVWRIAELERTAE